MLSIRYKISQNTKQIIVAIAPLAARSVTNMTLEIPFVNFARLGVRRYWHRMVRYYADLNTLSFSLLDPFDRKYTLLFWTGRESCIECEDIYRYQDYTLPVSYSRALIERTQRGAL